MSFSFINIKNFFGKILDFVLPKDPDVLRFETISNEEFVRKAEKADEPPISGALSIFNYKDPLVRTAIRLLKYKGNKHSASLLAETLYGEMIEELSDSMIFSGFEKPLLIPIPISNARRRERGWNQCELLAEALVKIDGGQTFEYAKNLLMKVKDAPSQTKKDRAERIKNIVGCFAVKNARAVSGRNIILLDDVITTGSTMKEAKKTLLSAGARKVFCVSVAH